MNRSLRTILHSAYFAVLLGACSSNDAPSPTGVSGSGSGGADSGSHIAGAAGDANGPVPTAGAAGDAPEIGAGATSADAGASGDAGSSGSAGEGGDASVAGSGGSAGSVAGAANGGGVGGAAQGGAAQGGAAQGGAAQAGAAQGGAAQGGASQGGAPQGGSGGAVNVAGAPSDPNAGLMIPCDVAKTYTVCHNCHTSPPSNGAPFALVTLKDHQDYKNLEIGDVTFGIMPLEGTLSPADRTLMLAWLGAGAMGVPQAACP